jgi:hypothetical protein
MRMIAILLQQRIEEVQVLSDLYDSLNEVKQDILDSTTKSVD